MDEDITVYGIWIKYTGWIKKGQIPVVFKEEQTAQVYARWFRGKVYPIDESLRDLEDELIEAEKARALWHILRNTVQKLRQSLEKSGS